VSARGAGRFIVIEGVEGAGKSTQTARLAAYLRERGREVIRTLEPGGTEVGLRIRRILLDTELPAMEGLTELFLYAAARAEHVRKVIRPALDAGRTVVCDRFSLSTLAYQGYGRGLPLDLVRELDAAARDGLRPDLTLVLDLPVAEGLGRNVEAGKRDRFEAESAAFHERVRQGFHELARGEGAVIVDARGGPGTVAARIRRALEERGCL